MYVKLISINKIDMDAFKEVLNKRSSDDDYYEGIKNENQSEIIINFAGKVCYSSDAKSRNKNITKVRNNHNEYLDNLIKMKHYSVFEHVQLVFYVQDVSIVLLKEVTRHRHLQFSVESGRYVRNLDWDVAEVPLPECLTDEEKALVKNIMKETYEYLHEQYKLLNNIVDWNRLNMHEKKEVTSYIRRILPEGRTTCFVISGNIRAWIEFLDKRLSDAAEVEIREFASKILDEMKKHVNIVKK